ncbi:putative ribonuclease H-like domain-containing protein [Tanacetum coccineum]
MTGNKSYLTDYQDIDGGFVAFAGSPKSFNLKNVVPSRGTKENIDAGQDGKKIVPNQEYILLPLLSFDPSLSKSSKDSPDARFKPSREEEKIASEHPENEDNEIVYFDDDEEIGAEADMNNLATTVHVRPIPTTRVHKDHPLEQNHWRYTFSTLNQKDNKELEPKKKVWTLVDLPYGKRAIGTKWVYKNKKDNRGIVVRNKARLVAQGYTQEEGIDYDEVFAPVARIEAIRLFLAYASFMNFIVYRMDVKSAFLYGIIEEEVYVCQPPWFEDPKFPNKVYKLERALYGLHQALRAWYKTLSTYLLENRFRRGTIDKTLFIKKEKDDILLVKQKDDGIFISQDKYVADILKKFDFATVKTASTPIETNKALLKDEDVADVDVYLYRSMIGSLMYLTASRPDIIFVVCACARDSPFDLEAFFDSDYDGASLDRKSTTGGCQFLRRRLISWQCKKQTIVANSTTEAKYVAATNCGGHVLWIQNQLLDYGYNFMNTKIFIDNESTICIAKNLVFYSKTKHIEIRHHFIRDSYEKRLIQVIKIHTDETVIKEWEDRMERAATTASSLELEQDSGNINRTQSMATLNESFPQGTDSGSGPRCQDTILGGAEAQI